MRRYNYIQLLDIMESRGRKNADALISRMMRKVEEHTGDYPVWSDFAPNWVVKNCINL